MTRGSAAKAEGQERLRQALSAELTRDVLPEAYVCAEHAKALHGDSIGAILFYGSCQRAETAEGLLDLYLLSTSNRAFHGGTLMAGLNYLVPPNIYFYSLEYGGKPLRAKVAAITAKQFGESCRGEGPSISIWARFCQPAVLLNSPSEEVTAQTVSMMTDAVKTAARWAALLGPEAGTSREYWVNLFKSTYGAELRPEREDRAALIYETHEQRYDRLLPDAWDALGIEWERDGDRYRVTVSPAARARAQREWEGRKVAGKGISLARIAKGAFTFDGGVDYLLWKIARHSGASIEVTDWQRRHPFLASPVVIAKLLQSGAVR